MSLRIEGVVKAFGDTVVLDPDPIRRKVGMVLQSFNLFRHMSVRDNVAVGPRRVLGRPKDEANQLASELLGRLGLADPIDAYPDQLSGGQQQRAAIARSLRRNPTGWSAAPAGLSDQGSADRRGRRFACRPTGPA